MGRTNAKEHRGMKELLIQPKDQWKTYQGSV